MSYWIVRGRACPCGSFFPLVCALALCFLGLVSATPAYAVAETEPNNTCAIAQGLGSIGPSGSVVVNGAITTAPFAADIDFYRVTGTPGTILQATARGISDGTDTLALPLLGVLNSACVLQQTPGSNDPVVLRYTLPADGVAVIAVSSCCDFSLIGANFYTGTYTLTIASLTPVPSIGGRVVDATTGTPIPNVQANIASCNDPACTTGQFNVYANNTDANGTYIATQTEFGTPLLPGTYVVNIFDYFGNYLASSTGPFQASGGQAVVVPDIAMSPVPRLGSIKGRIIDAVTHAPLSGVGAPHAFVSFDGCAGFSCSYFAGYTDDMGRFKFTTDNSGRGILANATLEAFPTADQYQSGYKSVGPFTNGAAIDLGDIPLSSNPIRFSILQGCSSVPASGGVCAYEIQMTNGSASAVQGQAWASINAFGLSSFVQSSTFQTGDPQPLNLAAATRTFRASRIAHFEFAIPGNVPISAFICPTFWFGSDPVDPQLNVLGAYQDYTSCVQRTASGYTPATPDQVEKMRREGLEHQAKQRAASH
jgi:hypothetical protein